MISYTCATAACLVATTGNSWLGCKSSCLVANFKLCANEIVKKINKINANAMETAGIGATE